MEDSYRHHSLAFQRSVPSWESALVHATADSHRRDFVDSPSGPALTAENGSEGGLSQLNELVLQTRRCSGSEELTGTGHTGNSERSPRGDLDPRHFVRAQRVCRHRLGFYHESFPARATGNTHGRLSGFTELFRETGGRSLRSRW